MLRKEFRQGLPGVRLLVTSHLLGSSLGHDPATVFPAFRAEINNPIGIADHVHVVLDDDDGVAEIGQAMQHVEKFADVVEVKAGRWLVKQVQRAPGLAFAEFASQLDSLCFASGKRDRGLAKMKISKSDID